MKQLQIRQKRIDKDWTLNHVSKHVGVTKTAIHDIETGRRRPSYEVLIKLCKLFQVPHEEIERLFAVAADEPKPQ